MDGGRHDVRLPMDRQSQVKVCGVVCLHHQLVLPLYDAMGALAAGHASGWQVVAEWGLPQQFHLVARDEGSRALIASGLDHAVFVVLFVHRSEWSENLPNGPPRSPNEN